MKRKRLFKILIGTLKGIAAALFAVSVIVAIKFSSWTLLPVPKLFIQPQNPDSVVLSLSTGYVSGYIVYFLTVVLQSLIRNPPMKKEAAERLAVIYRKSILLMLLMCKNACTMECWNTIIKESDLECFNDNYYSAMKRFDIKGEAESVYLNKTTMQPIEWQQYLSIEFAKMQMQLDKVFLQFHYYLSNDYLTLIDDIRNCKLFAIFTMDSSRTYSYVIGADGYKYYDAYNLEEPFSKPLSAPLFTGENIKNLKEFLEQLAKLFKLISKPASIKKTRLFLCCKMNMWGILIQRYLENN